MNFNKFGVASTSKINSIAVRQSSQSAAETATCRLQCTQVGIICLFDLSGLDRSRSPSRYVLLVDSMHQIMDVLM